MFLVDPAEYGYLKGSGEVTEPGIILNVTHPVLIGVKNTCLTWYIESRRIAET